MSRTSRDQHDKQGNLVNGYDYNYQCWVKDGLILNCGHKISMSCDCFGRKYVGLEIKSFYGNNPKDAISTRM